MLVLSRKTGEACIIDGGISVTVLRIMGNQVRLGISAPAEVRVYRQEVHERIRAEGAKPRATAPPVERPG